jgi:hypothetical protein
VTSPDLKALAYARLLEDRPHELVEFIAREALD